MILKIYLPNDKVSVYFKISVSFQKPWSCRNRSLRLIEKSLYCLATQTPANKKHHRWMPNQMQAVLCLEISGCKAWSMLRIQRQECATGTMAGACRHWGRNTVQTAKLRFLHLGTKAVASNYITQAYSTIQSYIRIIISLMIRLWMSLETWDTFTAMKV